MDYEKAFRGSREMRDTYRAHGAGRSRRARAQCSAQAHVLSCFTHNARRPQPLYEPRSDLLASNDSRARCSLGAGSAVGTSLRPLLDPAAMGSMPACDDAFIGTQNAGRRSPLDLLREAESGLRRLARAGVNADDGREANHHRSEHEAARRLLGTDQLAWFWHEWGLLREAEARHVVV